MLFFQRTLAGGFFWVANILVPKFMLKLPCLPPPKKSAFTNRWIPKNVGLMGLDGTGIFSYSWRDKKCLYQWWYPWDGGPVAGSLPKEPFKRDIPNKIPTI